jgi:hypothetical protein
MESSMPPLGNNGLLPSGVYPCTESEFVIRFVDSFPDSCTRPDIWEGFSMFREEIATALSATQWVGGSFVSAKLNPHDVDVVTYASKDTINALPLEAQNHLWSLVNGQGTTRLTHRTHAFFVPVCSADDPSYESFVGLRQYWQDTLGHTRPRDGSGLERGEPRGIISLFVGDAAAAPSVTAEGESDD